MRTKIKSNIERMQAEAYAAGLGADWHPIKGLIQIYRDASRGANDDPDLNLALSALRSLLPFVAAPMSTAAHEPDEPDVTPTAAKAKLKQLIGNVVPIDRPN